MAFMQVDYTDGRSENVLVTLRATCKAEEHGLANDWGSVNESSIRYSAYSVYAAMRMAGKTLPPFEQWMDTVSALSAATPPEATEENPTE